MADYAYLLRCADGTLYAGWTNNLEKRVAAHNAGQGAKYTRGRGPVCLVWSQCFENKSEAMAAEVRLKRMTKMQKEELVKSGGPLPERKEEPKKPKRRSAVTIRPEQPQEFVEIHDFVEEAFKTAAVSNGEEQVYVDQVRLSEQYLPELSLVGRRGKLLAGYLMLSQTRVVTETGDFGCLLAAPLCVAEKLRGKGVGTKLMEKALQKAKKLGYPAVFLVGDTNYYSRFGFVPASQFGIQSPPGSPPELAAHTMALELVPGALDEVQGWVEF